jgi:hypothetical protein
MSTDQQLPAIPNSFENRRASIQEVVRQNITVLPSGYLSGQEAASLKSFTPNRPAMQIGPEGVRPPSSIHPQLLGHQGAENDGIPDVFARRGHEPLANMIIRHAVMDVQHYPLAENVQSMEPVGGRTPVEVSDRPAIEGEDRLVIPIQADSRWEDAAAASEAASEEDPPLQATVGESEASGALQKNELTDDKKPTSIFTFIKVNNGDTRNRHNASANHELHNNRQKERENYLEMAA